MQLLSEYGIIMNHKKIIRIMKKYEMNTKIRRANPYKYAAKIRQENLSCENILNRQFNQRESNTAYWQSKYFRKLRHKNAIINNL